MRAAASRCPRWGRASWIRGSRGAGVPRSASRLIAAAAAAVRQSTHASCTSRASRAVWAWVPLMKASPSLGANRNGCEARRRERPGCRRGARGPQHVALAHQRQRHVAERRQISARADAALLRHHRDHPGVEHGHERVHQLRSYPAGRPEEHVGPKQHERAHDGGRQRSPHAGRMTADQIDLQLLELVGGDADVGELSEAGVDPVDRLTRGDGAPRPAGGSRPARHAPPASTRTRRPGSPGGTDDVLDREGASVERELCGGHRPKVAAPAPGFNPGVAPHLAAADLSALSPAARDCPDRSGTPSRR